MLEWLAREYLGWERLPVHYITEKEIKTTVDPQVYQEQVGLAEMVLEVEDIAQAVRQVRENATRILLPSNRLL